MEDAWLDTLPPAKATNAHLPPEPFQNDSDLVLGGALAAGLGPYLQDESPGLLSQGLCGLGLTGVALGHFWFLSRCGRSTPCTRSPNPPPSSGFSPLKRVPLSVNAHSVGVV